MKKFLLTKKKSALWLLGCFIAISIAVYWRYNILYPSTDNAYVQANIVNIAPQISGRIDHIAITNHQKVRAGDLLFTIDPSPFIIAVQQAQAEFSLAKQQAAANQDAVTSAAAVLAERTAELVNAKRTSARIFTLTQKGILPKQINDDATAKVATATATVNAARAQWQQAQDTYGQPGNNNALLQKAAATLSQAELDLMHTKIFAPAAGVAENFTLRTGDTVTANNAVFALVDDSQWWVDANYNETDLARMRVNQHATIELDMYAGKKFRGIVDSISTGSGTTFSLLPPENATGNWVKVTQRFPVRIRFVSIDPKTPPRVGASASVTIDTTT